MVEVGDRIRLSSMKRQEREGIVTAVTGSLVQVRWRSGEETTVVPAPGTLTVLAAGKVAPQKAAKTRAARRTVGVKKNIAGESATLKRNGAKKAKRPVR